MKLFLRSIFFIILSFSGNSLFAQLKFVASVSPASIGKNEYAQLELTVVNANGTPQITVPPLKNFIIVSGPNTMTGFQSVNGVSTTTFTQSFILRPRTAGRYVIGPASAIADGKKLLSNALVLQVTNVSQNNNSGNALASPFAGMDPFAEPQAEIPYRDYILRPGENVPEKIKKNIILKVEINKTSCYIGEPVIATYKLYTRLKSESNLTQNPSFNGFSVIDLQQPDINSYTREKLGGREYNVYVIRKAQIYPLQSGQLVLEPAEVENKIRFIRQEYVQQHDAGIEDVFKNFTDATIPPEGIVDQKAAVRSEPISITVKPLPEVKKPISFKSAVGNFIIKAGLDKNNFTTDDAGKLNISIAGEGNMQLITGPDIKWPAGIESFEGKTTDDLVKTTVPVSGIKLFEYPFTVSSPGDHTIPAIEFSFFNPASNSYKTIVTEPLSFHVSKGNGRPSDSVTVNQPGKEKFFNRLFNNRWTIIVPIILLVILGLFFWLRKENRKEAAWLKNKLAEQQRQEEQNKLTELLIADQADPLEPAKEYLVRHDSKGFYHSINDCFRHYLSKKLKIPFEELNKKNILEGMDKKGISNELSIQMQQLLDEIEWQLYTPFSEADKMQEIYERADELVQRINLG